jgi:hypothetical protein
MNFLHIEVDNILKNINRLFDETNLNSAEIMSKYKIDFNIIHYIRMGGGAIFDLQTLQIVERKLLDIKTNV